ncbi:heat shock protein HspQ [Arboricoccus pini]|uniref:Heat shock protein HspQ n=1 Tax=Arboricoccus pini TaxID=1963835 RepID=A0A212R316_9PROT|nr:heat shock protein HspQ [Arboricoccus pini]SNB66403.1 heat shock protein HspQ [Arboricoccus pini]
MPVDSGIAKMERAAKFSIGQLVRHRRYDFRGVVFDVDPTFSNSEEWYEAIPEDVRPERDQPFYHLLAENEDSYYVAYVSEQNLLADQTGEPIEHPQLTDFFSQLKDGSYEPKRTLRN